MLTLLLISIFSYFFIVGITSKLLQSVPEQYQIGPISIFVWSVLWPVTIVIVLLILIVLAGEIFVSLIMNPKTK
jgi:hypothetical protein